MHYVYILRCADGTLYTGYTNDLKARVAAHNSGRGARYTRGRRPVTMIYSERFRSLGKALRREHVVKQLTRAEKDALIARRRRTKTTRRRSGGCAGGSGDCDGGSGGCAGSS